MNNSKKFFISTAIPYVNAKPHLGFALELVQADVLARYHRAKGFDVFFVSGTDENALKNVLAAKKQNMGVKDFVDKNAQTFFDLKKVLNLSWDDFIRTTEKRHFDGATKFWLACKKDDIYKKSYRGLYCVGCEEFKTPKELVAGKFCEEHPNQPLEIVEEENYFFKLSKYAKEIESRIQNGELIILPEGRKREVLSFIRGGLNDLSISRSKERAESWGVPVPGDDSQVQYVWFDALTNYINALGYFNSSKKFEEFWENNENIIHLIGKGVTRFHAVYWPAMLLSANLRLPKKVLIHGYITVDDKKISKSLGNTIDSSELVSKYGVDAVRYYLLKEIPSGEDGNFSVASLERVYNGELANGLGNFAARVLGLASKFEKFSAGGGSSSGGEVFSQVDREVSTKIESVKAIVDQKIHEFRLHEALGAINELIAFGDKYVNNHEVWKDTDSKKQEVLNLVVILDNVAALLKPFLPETAEKIQPCLVWLDEKNLEIKKGEVLFPRLV
ncbi:MAG: methionine--tRNA ligase [Candidatus Liptonbacteria bacterium]|nr:methionine--tRNA ligase [Candidatus Liptonbacteria bacterium]